MRPLLNLMNAFIFIFPLLASRVDSAVDRENHTRHERGVSQVKHGVDDVFDLAYPAKRLHAVEFFKLLG